jgi:hypothetical protein
MYFFNNTVGGGWPDCIKNASHGSAFSAIFVAQGNHCINSTSSITDGTFTAPTLTLTPNVGMTQTTATSQGYGSLWAPASNCTLATCATLQAGTMKPSYFPTSGPVTGTFPYSDTQLGSLEETINGVVQSVWPARTPVAIPMTQNRDAGAYEFSAGGSSSFTWGSGSGSGSFNISWQQNGPPFYSVSSRSTANPGAISTIFTATSPTATTCSGMCQNSTAYDTTINPTGVDCYTRLTDGTTFPSGHSVGNLTHSGGDNDRFSSINEDYIMIQENGGFVDIFKVAANASGCLQVIAQVTGSSISGPAGFAWTSDTTFYYVVNFTQLWQGTINPTANTYTVAEVVNLFGSGVCPGVTTFTAGSGSILGISDNDQTFSWAIGPAGQASADWLFAWNASSGCTAVNFNSGSYWTFCASGCSPSTPAAGTLSSGGCYGSNGASLQGIHDTELSGDGNYAVVTITGPWTQGACAGSGIADQWTIWQIGTSGDVWACSSNTTCTGGLQFGAHESVGITHTLTPNQFGYNDRLTSAASSFTNFTAVPTVADQHLGWPHPLLDDSYPWVGASDAMLTTQGSITSPPYPQNLLFGYFPGVAYPLGAPPALFGHNFSCGAPGGTHAQCGGGPDAEFSGQYSICYPTAKGNWLICAMSMLNSLGNDNLGNPRTDAFSVRMQ